MKETTPAQPDKHDDTGLRAIMAFAVVLYCVACVGLAFMWAWSGQSTLALSALHGPAVLAAVLGGLWIGGRRACRYCNGSTRQKDRTGDEGNLIGPETGRPRNRLQLESLDGSATDDSPSIPTQ